MSPTQGAVAHLESGQLKPNQRHILQKPTSCSILDI